MSLDLEAIKARADAATPGEWSAQDTDLDVHTEDSRSLIHLAEVLLSDEDTRANHPQAVADAEFIAHAREDIPALLAEVHRLRVLVGYSA